MPKVLVMGAAVIDIILKLDKLPKSGEDITAEHKETVVGGCAYNVANVLKYLKVKHDLCVPVGIGNYSNIIKQQLKEDGYDVFIEDCSEDNGWNLSIVERDGERTFITVPGIETKWKEEWFKNINIDEYDYIYVSGYELEGDSGEVIVNLLQNKKQKCTIVFDASPRIEYIDKNVLDRLFKMGTIIHSNRKEISVLIGEENLDAAINKVYNITKNPVVVTRGKDGCNYYSEKESGNIPTATVKVKDTIGAGDSHTGGFIAGLCMGLSLEKACELGNSIASKVVQNQGSKLK